MRPRIAKHLEQVEELITRLQKHIQLRLVEEINVGDAETMSQIIGDIGDNDVTLAGIAGRMESLSGGQPIDQEWLRRVTGLVAGLKDLKHRVAGSLVDAGVLEQETGSVLKIFKRTIYPEADPGPEHELRDRMRQAIFTGTSQVETRTVIVIALARAAGMLDKVFPKKELKERKTRLEKLCNGQVAGTATKEAVEAVQAAILVATMVPIIVVSGTS